MATLRHARLSRSRAGLLIGMCRVITISGQYENVRTPLYRRRDFRAALEGGAPGRTRDAIREYMGSNFFLSIARIWGELRISRSIAFLRSST